MSKLGLKLIAFLTVSLVIGLGASFSENEVVVEDINFVVQVGYNTAQEKMVKVTNNTEQDIIVSDACVNYDTIGTVFDCRPMGGIIGVGETKEVGKIFIVDDLDIGTYTDNITVYYTYNGGEEEPIDYDEHSAASSVTLNVTNVIHNDDVITYIDTDGNEFPMGSLTISSGSRSITILDRNLGATKMGTGSDSYGYYFQWGNNYGFGGGENDSTSFLGGRGTLINPGTHIDASMYGWNNPYMSSNFVLGENKDTMSMDISTMVLACETECVNKYKDQDLKDACNGECRLMKNKKHWTDRAIPHNNNLWGGYIEGVRDFNRQGPCPEGYHVPTKDELNDLIDLFFGPRGVEIMVDQTGKRVFGQQNVEDFVENLFIPKAGKRNWETGKMEGVGIDGYLWSSVYNDGAFDSNNMWIRGDPTTMNVMTMAQQLDRSSGVSVRCFKDSGFSQAGTTITYDTKRVKVQPQRLGLGNSGYVPYDVTKNGLKVIGWYTDSGFQNEIEFIEGTKTFKTLTASNMDGLTVYGKWDNERIIKFDNKGLGDSIEDQIVNVGEKITNPVVSDVVGKVFRGWSKDSNGADGYDWDFDTVITEDMDNFTLYAKWSDGYELKYELDGGENNSNNPNYFLIGGSDIVLQNPVKTGYTFNGWFMEDGFYNQITRITKGFKQDLTLYAKWSVNSNGGGSSSGGGSGGGSRGDSSVKDNKIINNEVEENNTEENNEENNTDKSEMELAYEWAYKNGITTMDSIEKAELDQPLTRIAMAKMLSQYAMNVLGKVPANKMAPRFDDITTELNEEYYGGSELAYQLDIMGLNMPDNKFRPFDLVTRAEFGTAISRLLYGLSDGEGLYYETHLAKLKDEGIITNDTPELEEARGYIMLMLMRAANK